MQARDGLNSDRDLSETLDTLTLFPEYTYIRAGLIRTMNFGIPYCERVKRFYGQLISWKLNFICIML